MENLRTLELKVASWYKEAPHLPANIRKWIAENLWWLTLVGVILGTIGVFSILAILLAEVVIVGLSGRVDVSGTELLGSFVALLFATANIIIGTIAISPLKSLRKRGWSLMFLAALINVVSLLVSFLIDFDLFGLAYELIFAVIGTYFLFEIRECYQEARPKVKRAAKSTVKS